MNPPIRFTLNGETVTLETEPDRTLLWVLRTDLELTGTKYGCGAGMCGSCTVVVDGKPVRSCLTNLEEVQGKQVTTIEALAKDGELHPLQQAFLDVGGYQCGYCTPGMIMASVKLAEGNPDISDDEARHGLEGNMCRCTGYANIVAAVMAGAEEMK